VKKVGEIPNRIAPAAAINVKAVKEDVFSNSSHPPMTLDNFFYGVHP